MKPFPSLCLLALCLGPAGAASLDFSAATSPTFRIGVSDLSLAGGSLGLGVSNRAVDARFTNGLDLSVAGTVQAGISAAYAFSGGWRLGADAQGTLGPVAVNAALGYWTTSVAKIDPLAVWDEAGTPLSERGALARLSARYRVQRNLVLSGQGVLGPQNSLAAGVEYRLGGADSATLRGGLRGGDGVFGLSAGVSLPLTDSASLSADALLGPHSLGLTGSLSISDALGDGSTLRAYAAYEPWRTDALPLRAGLSASFAAGPGSLSLDAAGGTGGFGLRAAYQLPLGGQ